MATETANRLCTQLQTSAGFERDPEAAWRLSAEAEVKGYGCERPTLAVCCRKVLGHFGYLWRAFLTVRLRPDPTFVLVRDMSGLR